VRREYPYLLDAYYEDANTGEVKRNYLSELDNFVNQKQYIRITLLNWQEQPIKEIQGELSSGTLTKDGSSSVRRSCQLTAALDAGEYDVEDLSLDFSINKKIFVEIGIWNNTKQYKDYPILWFPQGIFYISSASLTSSTSNVVSISLSLKDKMCGLNGIAGGKFPSTTVFDEVDTQTASGAYVSEKVCIYDIIQEMVHHFGGEELENILIEDVPLRIKRIVKWVGDTELYIRSSSGVATDSSTGLTSIKIEEISTEPIEVTNNDEIVKEYHYWDDVGYVYDDFVYTSELTAAAGETVTSVLDKIVSYLGNYEYFYDELGIFHFREKKNYLNTTQGKIVLDDMAENDYLIDNTIGKSIYSFSDNVNIASLTQTPQYENIRNDFVVQGVRTSTVTSSSLPVMYHVAIDNKPIVGNKYTDLLLYTEPETNLLKAAFPYIVESLPEVGNFNIIYATLESTTTTNSDSEESMQSDNTTTVQSSTNVTSEKQEYHFYYWENDVYKELVNSNVTGDSSNDTLVFYTNGEYYTPTDWRTEMYLQGMLNKYMTTSANLETLITDFESNYSNPSLILSGIQNNSIQVSDEEDENKWLSDLYINSQRRTVDVDFYFEELDAFWPQIYDLKNQDFYDDIETNGCYYLDLIDPLTSTLGEYCVSNIGRRTNVTYSEDINCLFEPTIPDICFIQAVDGVNDTTKEEQQAAQDECEKEGQPWFQIKNNIYNNLATGGSYTSAFEQIKSDIWSYTSFQKSIAITALPVFYLDVNSRVTINDKTTNTYGDFMVSNISIPFGAGSMMAVSASTCLEKI
jgi:hypothetical protein